MMQWQSKNEKDINENIEDNKKIDNIVIDMTISWASKDCYSCTWFLWTMLVIVPSCPLLSICTIGFMDAFCKYHVYEHLLMQ